MEMDHSGAPKPPPKPTDIIVVPHGNGPLWCTKTTTQTHRYHRGTPWKWTTLVHQNHHPNPQISSWYPMEMDHSGAPKPPPKPTDITVVPHGNGPLWCTKTTTQTHRHHRGTPWKWTTLV